MSRDLYLAQNGKCFYCSLPMSLKVGISKAYAGWTRDHFIPQMILKSKGWKIKYNYVLSHPKCNVRKGCRFPTQEEVNKFKKVYRKMGILR